MLPALVALALLSGACSSSSGGARAPSTSSAPTEAVGGPTTSDPRASARPPGPGVPVAPIGGAGGAPGDRPEEMPQWAADHDLTVEWYSGGATLTAVFRGLDLGQLPPLCLTTAIESAPTRAAEGTTIAPTGDGGCNGAAGIVGSIQTCLDLAVYPQPSPSPAPAAWSRTCSNGMPAAS